MLDLELDFTEKDGEKPVRKTLDPGNYIGYITGTETKMNERTSTLQLYFKLKVDKETYLSRPFNLKGKDNNYYLKEALKKLDITFGPKETLSSVTDSAKGLKVELSVTKREFNGKFYTDIDFVKGLGKEEVPF